MWEKYFLFVLFSLNCASFSSAQSKYAEVMNKVRTVATEQDINSNYLTNLENGLKDQSKKAILSNAVDFLSSDKSPFNISQECLNDTERMLEGIANKENWAISMLDAMGKPEAGIQQGNFMWLGSYDECLNISAWVLMDKTNHHYKNFMGEYCLVGMVPQGMVLGGTPGIGTTIGFCLPRTCSQNDTEALANAVLSMAGVNVTATPAHATCKDGSPLEYDTKAIIVIFILSLIIFIITTATIVDLTAEYITSRAKSSVNVQTEDTEKIINRDLEDIPNGDTSGVKLLGNSDGQNSLPSSILYRLLLSFSAYTNLKKLLSTKSGPDDLSCIHGVRFLSMTWVILGHSLAFQMYASKNIIWFFQIILKDWAYQGIINATVSVDSFFLMSGLLVSYLFFKQVERLGSPRKINWLMFYFHRFWRLTPAYMLVLMVDTVLFGYFSDGPLFPNGTFDVNCKKYWWTNLLYINNFWDETKQCFAWAWYLANDMQFYWISPLILIPFYWHWIFGSIMVMVFCLINFISVGIISASDGQSASLFGGNQTAGGGMDFDHNYDKPWCRIAPYVIGIAIGYALFKTKRRVKLNWLFVVGGWMVAAVCCLAPLYGLTNYYRDFTVPTQLESSIYLAMFRASWAVGLGWVIFACLTGYGGYVNTILSWKALVPLSRLTYCAYLIHPIVMFVIVLSTRSPPYLNNIFVIYSFFGHLLLSYLLAVVTTLSFESPMIGLEKILLRK